jgi:multidrug resistance efflux pump
VRPRAGRQDKQPPATGRQLGDRVRSLSLAHVPEQRGLLATVLPWVIGLTALGGSAWFLYGRWTAPQGEEQPPTLVRRVDAPANQSAPASSGSRDGATAERTTASSPALPSSALSPPSKADIVLEAKGYIVPAHQILVSPKVNGMIVQLNIEEGRRVSKGDVLAVLESTDYQAEVQRAKAAAQFMRERLRELENGNRPEEIKRAEAEVREAEVQLVQLGSELERTRKLYESRANAQQEYDVALSKYRAQQQRVMQLQANFELMKLGPREERIAIARAEVAQADADVIKAEWRLGNCTIHAPISGTILKKNAEEGNIVNPIAFNGSFSLCEMADLSDLEVALDIQERDISRVAVGQKCRVRAEAYPQRVYQGVVDRLMTIADRAKGAIPVRVKIAIPADEEGVYLKPEMGAIVTFLQELATPAAEIPIAVELPQAPHSSAP